MVSSNFLMGFYFLGVFLPFLQYSSGPSPIFLIFSSSLSSICPFKPIHRLAYSSPKPSQRPHNSLCVLPFFSPFYTPCMDVRLFPRVPSICFHTYLLPIVLFFLFSSLFLSVQQFSMIISVFSLLKYEQYKLLIFL